MASSDGNKERLRKKHWLKALELAKLLFDDEGYFTDYLVEIEELVKNRHHELNGLVIEMHIVNKEVVFVERHTCLENCDHYQTLQDDETLMLTIDITSEHLPYIMNIGKDFVVEGIAIGIYYDSHRIICKVKSLARHYSMA